MPVVCLICVLVVVSYRRVIECQSRSAETFNATAFCILGFGCLSETFFFWYRRGGYILSTYHVKCWLSRGGCRRHRKILFMGFDGFLLHEAVAVVPTPLLREARNPTLLTSDCASRMNECNMTLISSWDEELDDLFTSVREPFLQPFVQKGDSAHTPSAEMGFEIVIPKTEPVKPFNRSKVERNDDLYTGNDSDDAKRARRRKPRMWRRTEDLRLERAVALFGKGTWHRVAQFVGTRTAQQCRERCQRMYGVDEHRTHARHRWTKEEDAQLRSLVEQYNGHWTKVARMMVNRNRFQCRDRYVNIIARNTEPVPWTVEEDDLLLQCVAKYGAGGWHKFGKMLGTGRPAYLIHRRYLQLCGHCEDD